MAPLKGRRRTHAAAHRLLGVTSDRTLDPDALTDEIKAAIRGGMADAGAKYAEFKRTRIDTGEVTAGDMLGSRADIGGRWSHRMGGAIAGI